MAALLMKIYLVTEEPYHDNSTILSAHSTLEKAKAAYDAPWQDDGYYVDSWTHVVSFAKLPNDRAKAEEYMIYELEVDP